jgi:Zn-dependent protease
LNFESLRIKKLKIDSKSKIKNSKLIVIDLQSALFLYIIIIFSSIIHEYAHGWMAYQLGDSTAERMGRLTLNPFAHIDPFGTVFLPLALLLTSGIFIGYAKPVPFDPRNLRNPRRDTSLVGIAGPASNILIAIVLGLIVRFFGDSLLSINAGTFFSSGLFVEFLRDIVLINIWLALFNLIPVPPLDGSKVLLGIIPKAFGGAYEAMERMGFASIIIAIFIAGMVIPYLVYPLFNLFVGQPFIVF